MGGLARALLLIAAALLGAPGASGAQTPTLPSTLRYGSGLLDVPVSAVLPHGMVTGTVSGFFVRTDRSVQVDDGGASVATGPGVREFFTDGAIAVGLFDRGEIGLSLQALGDEGSGGDLWGAFGQFQLIAPVDEGIGVGVGARYLTAPDYPDGVRRAPGRLGFPDPRLRDRYPASGVAVGSNLSLYGVATAYLRGYDGGPLPEHDVTISLGYGSGMFGAGGGLDFYGTGSNGFFLGSSVHIPLRDAWMLALMAEYNGFDVNLGVQADLAGLRLGAHLLALNHPAPPGGHNSEYLAPKLGVLASVAVCPRLPGRRCRAAAMRRVEPDTIWIPAPPPDTVFVAVAEALAPEGGDETTICLSTGENVTLRTTLSGDTLVGPSWVRIEEVRPTLDFAGGYAGGSFWFERQVPIVFEGRRFRRSGDSFPIDCGQLLRVGTHEGVPVFADRAVERPLEILFIPERPGVWRRYDHLP